MLKYGIMWVVVISCIFVYFNNFKTIQKFDAAPIEFYAIADKSRPLNPIDKLVGIHLQTVNNNQEEVLNQLQFPIIINIIDENFEIAETHTYTKKSFPRKTTPCQTPTKYSCYIVQWEDRNEE
jgi:hypothetical protein